MIKARLKKAFENTELDLFFELSKYACGDAGAFPGNINNTRDYYYTNQVLNRAAQVLVVKARDENEALLARIEALEAKLASKGK